MRDALKIPCLHFIGMEEHGTDIKSQLGFGTSRTEETIAQLLQYNYYSQYKEGAATHRHSKDNETPFPVYIGMSVYAKTRIRGLAEVLHEHDMEHFLRLGAGDTNSTGRCNSQ